VVQLIAATRTDTGLTVRAELDENKYPKGIKVSDAQFTAINISRHSFQRSGDILPWNSLSRLWCNTRIIHLRESELLLSAVAPMLTSHTS
jgi:Rhodopirellula transposase DDE domain